MSSYAEAEQEQVKVRNADAMSTDFFRKHMEARHGETILRFKYLDWGDSEYLEACWRAYHNSVHRLGLHDDLDHYHGT
jgi:hypothetical protein